ncbi:ABC transporter permease [Pseudohongiella spirulinae]|uniref:Transport permease protein n=1 Tax=Pseudohongiella spirulinae TaxID=1249552 RepID=A0A0S2K8T8_9GAMM|nr:ABC transporter permease [Pseudohongiella spirulinae]ALO44753.1 Transport permease protein [Pseudohongiella spirulinae]
MKFSLVSQWTLSPVRHFRLFNQFVRQEFRGQFAGSLGGFLWLFVTPVVNIAIYSFVFSVVFRAPIPDNFGDVPFVIFLMIGYLPWFAFADAMGRASGLLIEKAPLITKVMFPVQLIPMVGTIVPYMVHGIAFFVFLIYLSMQGYLQLVWLWLPVALGLQFMFTIGLVAVLSAFCVFLRDIQQIVTLMLTAWFFLTPIIYPLSLLPEHVQPLMILNPMHSFVQFYREVILLGEFSMQHFQIMVIAAVLSYLLGGWLFMRIKHAFGDVL